VVDVVFLVDILISCFSDEYSEPGQLITNWDIIKQYGKGYLVTDILGCLPGLIGGEQANGGDLVYMLKFFRVCHFGRLYLGIDVSIRTLLQNCEKHVLKNINMCITLNFTFCLIWHAFACIWVIVGRHTDADGNEGWVLNELKLYEEAGMTEETKILALWASAFYFVVTTSTTVGYGDYYATTIYERFFCLILQFVGICIFSTLQDQVSKYEFTPSLNSIV
jgi:hypothetical protein